MEARIEGWESRLLDRSVLRLVAKDETTAAEWFETCRWPDGVCCLRCNGDQTYLVGSASMSGTKAERRREWKCRDCYYVFTVRPGSFLSGSKSPLTAWCVALSLALDPDVEDLVRELVLETGIQRRTAQRIAPVAQGLVDECQKEGVVPTYEMAPQAPQPVGELEEGEAALPAKPEPDPAAEQEELPRITPRDSRYRKYALAMLLTAVAAVAAIIGSASVDRTEMRTEWISWDGSSMMLSTDRRRNESKSAWQARHDERLRLMQDALNPGNLAKGGIEND